MVFVECFSNESEDVFCISEISENSPDKKWSLKFLEPAEGSYAEDSSCCLETWVVFPVGALKIVQINLLT